MCESRCQKRKCGSLLILFFFFLFFSFFFFFVLLFQSSNAWTSWTSLSWPKRTSTLTWKLPFRFVSHFLFYLRIYLFIYLFFPTYSSVWIGVPASWLLQARHVPCAQPSAAWLVCADFNVHELCVLLKCLFLFILSFSFFGSRYLKIQLEDLKGFQDALDYISGLDFEAVCENLIPIIIFFFFFLRRFLILLLLLPSSSSNSSSFIHSPSSSSFPLS